MRRLALLILLSLLPAGIFLAPAHADKRVALVVGNSSYRNVGRLDNPANDAKLLSDTLRAIGFTLVIQEGR
jgi:Caspase domain